MAKISREASRVIVLITVLLARAGTTIIYKALDISLIGALEISLESKAYRRPKLYQIQLDNGANGGQFFGPSAGGKRIQVELFFKWVGTKEG